MSKEREIKFRAYGTEEKEMYHDVHFDYLEVSTWDNDEWVVLGDRESGGILQHCPIMQYTGLKDKNGKEIYEGDIFQFHYEDGPGGRGVVFWHDEMAAWMWHPTDHDESMSTLMPEYQVMEVIGSIYETPELLK